jgi:hypothetical protein
MSRSKPPASMALFLADLPPPDAAALRQADPAVLLWRLIDTFRILT